MRSTSSRLLSTQGLVHRMAAALRRRHLLLPCILIVQLLLLALLSLDSPVMAPPAVAAPISMFDVRSPGERPPQAEPQPKPIESVRVTEIKLKVETSPLAAEPVFSAAAAEQAGFGTTCDIADTLARAFTSNEALKSELARIGPESRSVANAIMFWDGGWVKLPASAPQAAIQTLRRAIIEGVEAAPAECLTQEVTGPRFIAVTGADSTIMLVLGSGAWRWEQFLISPNDAEPAGDATLPGRQNEK